VEEVMLKTPVQQESRWFGYEFSRISEETVNNELQDYPCIDLLDMVMQDYVKTQPDVFFVQIGAHDGVSADPANRQIRKYPNWHGILVEPQPTSFQQLVASYSQEPRFIFEQVAIGAKDGATPFYTVTDEISALTFWLPQSASLDREHVRGALHYWKHTKKIDVIPDDLESAIKVLSIPTLTMRSLIHKHQVPKVDFCIQIVALFVGYGIGGYQGVIVGIAASEALTYIAYAVCFARLSLWQPEVDFPVIVFGVGLAAIVYYF
jgi:FkbM family methyltransferase